MTTNFPYSDTVKRFIFVFFRARQQMQPCFSSLRTSKTGYASQSVRQISWSSPLHCSWQKIFLDACVYIHAFFLFLENLKFLLFYMCTRVILENRKLLRVVQFHGQCSSRGFPALCFCSPAIWCPPLFPFLQHNSSREMKRAIVTFTFIDKHFYMFLFINKGFLLYTLIYCV